MIIMKILANRKHVNYMAIYKGNEVTFTILILLFPEKRHLLLKCRFLLVIYNNMDGPRGYQY